MNFYLPLPYFVHVEYEVVMSGNGTRIYKAQQFRLNRALSGRGNFAAFDTGDKSVRIQYVRFLLSLN